jgi:hypothetical protein
MKVPMRLALRLSLVQTLVGIASLGSTMCEAQANTPSALIKILSQRGAPTLTDNTFSCGSLYEDSESSRVTTMALVKLGHSAVPDIEAALDSIQRGGVRSDLAYRGGWLLFAYAKILGPTAYPRLRSMIASPDLGFLQNALETSIAISLSLTSYADSSREPAVAICAVTQPRDGLDQLILSWLQGDLSKFRESLGPKAGAALTSILAAQTWEAMRADLVKVKFGPGAAVGYRFDGSGGWADPRETFADNGADRTELQDGSDVETQFTDRSGVRCGRSHVKFFKTEAPLGRLRYLIDNADLVDLLRVINNCAVQPDTPAR